MRTAETIAQMQEMKPAKVSKRGKHPNSRANLKPVKNGDPPRNPTGRNGWVTGTDVAAILARAVIEGNYEAAYKGLAYQLSKGNAYTFKELAVRAYGNLPQHVNVTNTDSVSNLLVAGRQRVARRKAPAVQ